MDVLHSARVGDVQDIRTRLQSVKGNARDALANYVQPETLNTPLHMACANGHVECVRELLCSGAKHLPNANGNWPLHWAVQNQHRETIELIIDRVKDLDVLARNKFGRGCVTEAYQCEDTEILAMLLEHSSATEERLAEGTGMFVKDAIQEEIEEDYGRDSSLPTVVQETVLDFQFAPGLPVLRARELALDWSKDAFGSTGNEDITGVSIWSAALILGRWILDHRSVFDGKQVCELGSGCGVSGLAVYKYTNAARVVLSDWCAHTMQNLEHNVELNKVNENKTKGEEPTPTREEPLVLDCCSRCGAVQRFTPDNPTGKLMLCCGCKSVAYCGRACQKKAWKRHKANCQAIRDQRERAEHVARERGTIQVLAIDWAEPKTWPLCGEDDKYHVLLGSDLVYHHEIVPVLANVVDGMLAAEGQFIHVASQARHSLVEFKDTMKARGFSCKMEQVPAAYKTNPLVGHDAVAELFALHFNEMSDEYCIYTFTRAFE